MFVPAVQYAGMSNRPGASRGQLRAAARPQRSLSQPRPLPLKNDRGSFPEQCDAGGTSLDIGKGAGRQSSIAGPTHVFVRNSEN